MNNSIRVSALVEMPEHLLEEIQNFLDTPGVEEKYTSFDDFICTAIALHLASQKKAIEMAK